MDHRGKHKLEDRPLLTVMMLCILGLLVAICEAILRSLKRKTSPENLSNEDRKKYLLASNVDSNTRGL